MPQVPFSVTTDYMHATAEGCVHVVAVLHITIYRILHVCDVVKENRMKKIESLPEELLSLIRHGEDYQIEYKEAYQELPKSLFDTVSSFSNRKGGDIFLGVHVFEIIIPLTTGSMTKVGPGTDGASGEVSGQVGGQVGGQVSGQASGQAVMVKLDGQRLMDLRHSIELYKR